MYGHLACTRLMVTYAKGFPSVQVIDNVSNLTVLFFLLLLAW